MMSASAPAKLFRASYKTDDVNVTVDSDLVVWEDVFGEKGEKVRIPVLLSIAGYENALKSLTNAITSGKMFWLESDIPDTFRYTHVQAIAKSKFRVERAKLPNGGTHLVIITEDAFDNGVIDSNHKPIMLAWDGDMIGQFYRTLTAKYTTIIRESWTPWLWAKSVELNFVKELTVYTPLDGYSELRAARLLLQDDELAEIVSEGIRSGELDFPDGVYDADISDIENLSDYLSKNGETLSKLVTSIFAPLHNPREDVSPLIDSSSRSWFLPQKHVIQAVVKKHQDGKSGMILVGEPGVGKTGIGGMIPYVLFEGKPFRGIVMCPGHLVRKWKREIEAIVPGAKATVIEHTTIREGSVVRELSPVQVLERYRQFSGDDAPKQPEFLVISKEIAKLSYFQRPAVQWSDRRHGWVCPDCGEIQHKRLKKGKKITETISLPKSAFDSHTKKNHFCSECGSVIWTADNRNVRRVPIAKYLKTAFPKNYFNYFIADELHELKGDTAQGQAFAILSSVANYTLGLTGTLLGGYADDIFRTKARMDFESLQRDGIGHRDIGKWMKYYGVMERFFRTNDDDLGFRDGSVGKKPIPSPRRRPGISPLVFVRHLLDICVFLDLAELGHALPPYQEEVRMVSMSPEQKDAYEEYQKAMKEAMSDGDYKVKRLSNAVVPLLAYPDRPFAHPPIVGVNDKGEEKVLYSPPQLPNIPYPKDIELISICREHKEKGRRVIVAATFTDRLDVLDKIAGHLLDNGFKVRVMRSENVPSNLREQYFAEAERDGIEVIVANPELFKTGLDLYGWPTIVYYQTGYSIFTLVQSSHRPRRPFQKNPVMVYFLAYRETMQETALQLIGQKYEAAMTVQGKFSEDGLRALSGGMDMMTELAKRLVESVSTDDTAEAYWERMRSKGAFASVDLTSVVEVKTVGTKEMAQSALELFRKKMAAKRAGKSVPLSSISIDPTH